VGLTGGARGCARTWVSGTAARVGRAGQAAGTHTTCSPELERAISGDPTGPAATSATAAASRRAGGRAELGSACGSGRSSCRTGGSGLECSRARSACSAGPSGAGPTTPATGRGASRADLGIASG
jgi:hypothetical protein